MNASSLAPYLKLVVALVGVLLTGLSVLYGTDPNVQLLISVATAAGVYHIPNQPVK